MAEEDGWCRRRRWRDWDCCEWCGSGLKAGSLFEMDDVDDDDYSETKPFSTGMLKLQRAMRLGKQQRGKMAAVRQGLWRTCSHYYFLHPTNQQRPGWCRTPG